MEKEESYNPISCNYYDHLEALATLQRKVTIRFLDEKNNHQWIEGKIKDFQIREKVEHLMLESGESIRLDRLISVDGLLLNDYPFC